ncbi:hypothetical protein BB560_003101 [Smittium megazygosporum]|uniref:acireductone dioxygenase (Fe(2+)-requiring) n=1 Tax=Smittium megazygosporum TaxID=133381 RepID=A0A2T9ZCY2_9FUNG|nr:hypothetical protein BB560_003101 [Smittium megazygosporum]
MRAYYFAEDSSDNCQPHDSGIEVSPETLEKLGVFYARLTGTEEEKQAQLDSIAKERNYNSFDVINLSTLTPDLDKKLDVFFDEHLHEDEEIRCVLQGSGYFDVRDLDDKWIRIHVVKDDFIITKPPKTLSEFPIWKV